MDLNNKNLQLARPLHLETKLPLLVNPRLGFIEFLSFISSYYNRRSPL